MSMSSAMVFIGGIAATGNMVVAEMMPTDSMVAQITKLGTTGLLVIACAYLYRDNKAKTERVDATHKEMINQLKGCILENTASNAGVKEALREVRDALNK